MSVAFFTGFPGFLGSELLVRVLTSQTERRAVCLVQPKFMDHAHTRLVSIEQTHPKLRGRVELVAGDITKPKLGLEDCSAIQATTTEVFHLAAIYDLSVPRDVAMKVNVLGTRNVLDFAADMPRFERLQYVSTCYVSGRFPGVFRECDLDEGQSFNNYYEETKNLAEVEVQDRMRDGMPTTIYRPAIVVGDSRTGVTQKFDGPYFVIRWLLRQPKIAVMPLVGRPSATRVNLVPRDFIVDAISHLSQVEISLGKVYQLADPQPLTVNELLAVIADATQRKIVRVPCPLRVAKFAVNHVPGIQRVMQSPSPAMDYFVHPTLYDCENTVTDLGHHGIQVPRFRSYVERLVEFVVDNPGISARPMA